jgi:hypothetical protein
LGSEVTVVAIDISFVTGLVFEVRRSDCSNGFKGQNHAGLKKYLLHLRIGCIVDVWFFVDFVTYTMTSQFSEHRKSCVGDDRMYTMGIFVDSFSWSDMFDRFVERFLGCFHKFIAQRICQFSSYHDSDSRIGNSAIVGNSAVYFEYVTVLKHIVIRDAMNDTVVDRKTEIHGVILISFECSF